MAALRAWSSSQSTKTPTSPGPHSMRAVSAMSLRRGSLPTSWAPSLRMGRASRLEEAPLPRSSPRYPAELSQFPDGLLHEAFRKLFRSHAAGGSVRRDNFINLA